MEQTLPTVRQYFNQGLAYKEIVALLCEKNNISISERHLKRLLKQMGLFRLKNYSNIENVAQFIEREIRLSGSLHGYRWMHLKCLHHGFVVQKERVRELLNTLDPAGVEMRKKGKLQRRHYSAKGPNFIWHLDSYDKLTPYGIGINTCIDGYSRNILWLEAGKTNSDPRVIAGYFIDAVVSQTGTALFIRGDMGTENTLVAQMQVLLRENDNGSPAFIYGTSQHNQRIESWWGQLRKENTQFWKTLFENMKADAKFNGDVIDKGLIQFCFLYLIKVSKIIYYIILIYSML